MRYGCLGPQGTFSEEASLEYYRGEGEIVFFPSNSLVVEAVATLQVPEGFVAYENSAEGSINETINGILKYSTLRIKGEYIFPVNHQLLALREILPTGIKTLISHPQAIAQCREFIHHYLAQGVDIEEVTSTSKAIERLKSHSDIDTTAAIGSLRAAKLHHLHVLRKNIQDSDGNVTRFIVIALADNPKPTGKDKTSIIFTCEQDTPGSLVRVLKVLGDLGINMSKIESRPTRKSLGEYHFFVDFGGHRENPIIAKVLEEIAAQTLALRVLGSYPALK